MYKFSLNPMLHSAATSDEWLKSYVQKTAILNNIFIINVRPLPIKKSFWVLTVWTKRNALGASS
jgi:hypothetical protein